MGRAVELRRREMSTMRTRGRRRNGRRSEAVAAASAGGEAETRRGEGLWRLRGGEFFAAL